MTDNIVEMLLAREATYEETTEEIFFYIFPVCEAFANYINADITLMEWMHIRLVDNLVHIQVDVYETIDLDRKRRYDIGIPIELMITGTPEEIILFLKQTEEQKAAIAAGDSTLPPQSSTEAALVAHLAEQTKGTIH